MLAHADLDSVSSSSDYEPTRIPSTSQNLAEHTPGSHMERCDVETSAHAATPEAKISSPRPLLKVVAVTVSGPTGSMNTYALLDDGCTATFIDSEISKCIGAEGPSKHVRIDCVGGLSRECQVKHVDFIIRGKHCSDSFQIRGARSIESLGVNYRPAVEKRDINKFTYLSDVSDFLCCEEAKPMLIIGVDNWQLTIATATRAGKTSQPVAIRTALGWVLYGFVSSKTSKVEFLNHAETNETDFLLENTIKEYYKLDSIGITKKDHHGSSDSHAINILETTTQRLPNGHFETGLLWRPNMTQVPNSFKLALSRFLSLESKMKRDNEYAELYKQNIHAMFDKHYAEKCTEHPVGTTWYLPHFGVRNCNKPGKLRVVHDAAAKCEGVSLNSLLLPGPDLLQPLHAILMRFREQPIALTADIREMFPQVSIRKQDRDAQRFIWRDNPTDKLGLYRMSSMMFGACSSPCTALYIKNLNAAEFEHIYPEASHATTYDVYMDDYIGSHVDTDVAAQMAIDIAELNQKAGFEMRDWISNDSAALARLPLELRSKKLPSIHLGCNTENISRVLGLRWQPARDIISFSHGLKNSVPPSCLTKRDALSHLMQIYDPLGFLGPLVSRGRIMFQTTWRHGISWDDKLPQTEQKVWQAWFEDLLSVSHLKVPRYYSLREFEITQRELHVFCDASESAYATVAYWRFVFSNGIVKLALIGSKSRVAPLKPTSIPRLELQAALIASRFASFICDSHKFKPQKRVFWCDSLNVLGWLHSDARSYKPFVAHRIGEVLELSDVSEWRWVPTSLNVADDATRVKRTSLTQESRWLVGPDFLLASEEEWPTSAPVDTASNHLEQKPSAKIHCHLTSLESSSIPLVVDPNRFSSWRRLIRSTARAYKFIQLLKDKNTPKDLNAVDLQRAELNLLRKSQMDTFPEKINCLTANKSLPRKSRLYNLSPIIDEDHLIRLNGRINRAPDVDDHTKRPIILDPKHSVVQLLITHHHIKAAHANNEMVVNEIRQKYWILNIRSAVRSTTHRCLHCRIRRSKPLEPIMGDLPDARLAHHRRVFSFVGLDYFGPLHVTIGRRREKRYVALFTCLVVRAVHLEVVHSLTTDAALMSLRRFIARRGTPSEIWSDNGTAFVGADRVLRALYGDSVTTFAANERIAWRFIPPSAPFMGGAWERLVRSIKTTIHVTLREKAPTDEVLQTFLFEAESIVNTRPLTHVPSNPSEEALTPFHFILGTSSGRPIPASVSDADLLSREGWRKSVRLLDHFWQRWVREYLTNLVPRRGGGVTPNLKEGDLVLVADGQLPRGIWPRGKVTKVYFGRDGVARVADVLTLAGPLKRPLKKLVQLTI